MEQISDNSSCSLVPPNLFALLPEEFHSGWSDRLRKKSGGAGAWSPQRCISGPCGPGNTTRSRELTMRSREHRSWGFPSPSLSRENPAGMAGFLLLTVRRRAGAGKGPGGGGGERHPSRGDCGFHSSWLLRITMDLLCVKWDPWGRV